MSRIFVSYRRQDSGGEAWALSQHLERIYGEKNVFFDVDRVRPGMDFVEEIERRVAEADALVLVIGPTWQGTADGQSRLENPEDHVRREIATALVRGVPIYPVLVGGAEMPSADALPEPLRPIHRLNGISLAETNRRAGMQELVAALPRRSRRSRALISAGIGGAILLAGLAGLVLLGGNGRDLRTLSAFASPTESLTVYAPQNWVQATGQWGAGTEGDVGESLIVSDGPELPADASFDYQQGRVAVGASTVRARTRNFRGQSQAQLYRSLKGDLYESTGCGDRETKHFFRDNYLGVLDKSSACPGGTEVWDLVGVTNWAADSAEPTAMFFVQITVVDGSSEYVELAGRVLDTFEVRADEVREPQAPRFGADRLE